MGRAPCCDKANVKRGPWSLEEDKVLKSYVESNGTGGNWIALPQKAGLKRCGKSCRLRWLNYLRPDIKHGGFTEEEDNIISTLYKTLGSRWSVIASHLPGRTDNDVKNYWNTKLKKKVQKAEETNKKTSANEPINPINTPIASAAADTSVKTETHDLYSYSNSINSLSSFLMDSELNLIISPQLSSSSHATFSEPSSEHIMMSPPQDMSVSSSSSSFTVDSFGGGGSDGLLTDMGFWTSSSDFLDWNGLQEYIISGVEDFDYSKQQELCQNLTYT